MNKVMKPPVNWSQQSLTDFANTCLAGFGRMNKNDFEVALFHLFLENNDLRKESDFALSIMFKMPESKVKRLRYEEALQFPVNNDEAHYKDAFINLLTNGHFRVTDNHRIQFAISDKLFRLYISDLLMRDGRFADSSFNPNIVSLPWKDLEYLLNQFDSKTKERLDKIKTSIKEGGKDVPKTITECLQGVVKDLIKNSAKKVGGDALADFICFLEDKIIELLKQEKTL